MKKSGLLICLLMALLTACNSRPENVQFKDALPEIYPDYVGVTIPVGIAPLNFAMADDDFSTLDVVVRGKIEGSLHANGSDTDFDIDEWHELVEKNRGSQLVVTVCAEKNKQWTQFRDFTIDVSSEPLEDWGVTYRLVAPGYVLYGLMGLHQRNLSNFEETALIKSSQIDGHCVNCHTPNRSNPEQYVFHVRGKKGATVIHRNGRDEFLQAKNELIGGSMVYPYWHPGGRYCAFSTNATSQMFHGGDNKRIEVYDSSSDVFIYDAETNTTLRDTLIMKHAWAENTPAFSPDGQWLYFTTALRQQYPDNYDKEKYSLCRVAFDEKNGSIGQHVDTLIHTATTGKSVSWPRPSLDGRYLMYTQADYGYFTIWHPEADLWLLDLNSGETHPLDRANSPQSESFHNWSQGSKWFLFTSRRENGLYTRLYFSMIDAQGNATKPFLLPQCHPKQYYNRLLFSYNTPDFTSQQVDAHPLDIARHIENEKRIEVR